MNHLTGIFKTTLTAEGVQVNQDTIASHDALSAQFGPDEHAKEVSAVIVAEPYDAPRVMSADNNYLTVSMLKDVVRRGTARKALVLNRQDLAGKTGTTNDYVDAWFSGFTSKNSYHRPGWALTSLQQWARARPVARRHYQSG